MIITKHTLIILKQLCKRGKKRKVALHTPTFMRNRDLVRHKLSRINLYWILPSVGHRQEQPRSNEYT